MSPCVELFVAVAAVLVVVGLLSRSLVDVIDVDVGLVARVLVAAEVRSGRQVVIPNVILAIGFGTTAVALLVARRCTASWNEVVDIGIGRRHDRSCSTLVLSISVSTSAGSSFNFRLRM